MDTLKSTDCQQDCQQKTFYRLYLLCRLAHSLIIYLYMTPRESYNFAPVYWSRWVVLVVGLVRAACVAVVAALFVALAVGVVAVVGLDVDRGHGLGFVVGAYTYL